MTRSKRRAANKFSNFAPSTHPRKSEYQTETFDVAADAVGIVAAYDHPRRS